MSLDHKSIDLPFHCNLPDGAAITSSQYVQYATDWVATVMDYERDPDALIYAWNYIDRHPVFWRWHWARADQASETPGARFLYVHGAMSTGWAGIEAHQPDMTATAYTMRWEIHYQDWENTGSVHAWELDGEAASYEEAVFAIALRLHHHFGNDRRKCRA